MAAPAGRTTTLWHPSLVLVCTPSKLSGPVLWRNAGNGDARHRETIAARIIDLARNGVIDAEALSERVLAESKAARSL